MTPAPTWVLLPGLDGTGSLFTPLLRSKPADQPVQVVSYPTHEPLSYEALAARVRLLLPDHPFVLVGESFSGPLALRLAADLPEPLRGVVLVASFGWLPSPFPSSITRVALSMAGARRPPRWLASRLLLGRRPDPSLVDLLGAAIDEVAPTVIAARLQMIATVDSGPLLAQIAVPLAYLRATRDALVGPRALRLLRVARPDMAVAEVDAPHLVLQCAPSECVQYLARWAESWGSHLPG
ncbi:MAG: alpha/beta fold hydrolase [Deltaproteobacteria bacterium]|nr:alpha/beta fold hydrolase [Deltaproteobacteria bacterium]